MCAMQTNSRVLSKVRRGTHADPRLLLHAYSSRAADLRIRVELGCGEAEREMAFDGQEERMAEREGDRKATPRNHSRIRARTSM